MIARKDALAVLQHRSRELQKPVISAAIIIPVNKKKQVIFEQTALFFLQEFWLLGILSDRAIASYPASTLSK